MKAFLMAVLALIVISVAAEQALMKTGFSTAEKAAGSAVRLDQPAAETEASGG